MKLIAPPDVDPVDLFLKLIEWPAPAIALDFRLSLAPEQRLFTQAIHGVVWQRIWRMPPIDRRAALIATSVVDADGRKLLPSPVEANLLPEADHIGLAEATTQALRQCSPWFGYIDEMAWRAMLAEGGRSLWPIVESLADCGTVAIGYGAAFFNEEPERYWGCARKDLLDGHLLVYSVARHLVED